MVTVTSTFTIASTQKADTETGYNITLVRRSVGVAEPPHSDSSGRWSN